jgi:predicted dithiol-disulfide oxidoreductase (DUF899 family)
MSTTIVLQSPKIVSREEWLAARRQLLAEEKEILAVCIGKFRKFVRANRLGLFQKTKEK